mmetsp:Transcript_1149/g.2834  ORF Transcript_1149/g.2834 Transcript_1149/m.2834 type:complete len:320 (+) Transcript_1149:41-1000(+)
MLTCRAFGAAALCLLVTAPLARGAQQPPLTHWRQRSSLALDQTSRRAQRTRQGPQPRGYAVTKLREFPHEGKPWTQGLEFAADGRLIETSGDYPAGTGSFVRVVDRQTGATIQSITDGVSSTFLEGIVELNGRWFATTYLDHQVLELNQNLELQGTHPYPFEGWGFTRSHDNTSFLATNGSQWVMTFNASTYEVLSTSPATCLGRNVMGINELEMVDDFLGHGPALLGNLMSSRLVLVMDPATFQCTGAFHLEDLEPVRTDEFGGFHVANGIAYDPRSDTFVVTGKNWDSMFEIRVGENASSPQPAHAIELLERYLNIS